jgi:muconolactone delta-isomerase
MKYLVTLELIGTPPASPQELVQHIEQIIIPMHERLDTEKKILAGGIAAGARAITFILDAASHDELDQLLMSLPGWGLMKVDVIPLQSFKDRIAISRQMAERFKTATH